MDQAPPESFQTILRRERAQRGWSQANVAEKIGSDPKTVGRWERGLTFPSLSMCQQLSTLFGKTVQELGLAREVSNLTGEHTIGREERGEEKNTTAEAAEQEEENRPVAEKRRPIDWKTNRKFWAISGGLMLVALLTLSTGGILRAGLPGHPAPAMKSPLMNPYTNKGILVLNDTLKENTAASWSLQPDDEGNCFFADGSYRIKAIRPGGYMKPCLAATTYFSNFTYEVTMRIVAGGCGGLAFRVTFPQLYYFLVCQDGHYRFVRYDRDHPANRRILVSAVSPLIRQGQNSLNVLAVVADGENFTLYVNQRKLYQDTDTAYLDGQIGLIAHPCMTTYADPQLNLCAVPIEVAFNNARVWKG